MKACLREEADKALRPFGIGFKEAWEEHALLYRHRDKKCIVLGHYFSMEEGWTSNKDLLERLKEACNPSFSVKAEDANGFFCFLGVGNYKYLLNDFTKMKNIKFFVGYRKGRVYIYGRNKINLYKKLIGKVKRNERKSF